MKVAALAIFVVAYAVIATERFHRTAVALAGAGLVLAFGILDAREAFQSEETGIDWNVIFLLLGMMLIVAVLRRTGLFEYVAIWSAKRARGRPFRIMAILCVVTAIASALLDNVTTVLLIAPVTILVAERLGVSPVPYLIAEIMASNIGGAATLVGDPPNIIIGSEAGLSYGDFISNLAPISALVLVVFLGLARLMFGRDLRANPDRVAEVMALEEREAITNPGLLVRALGMLLVVTIGFLLQTVIDIEPSIVALLGAGILVVLAREEIGPLLKEVEWSTLVFFMGLFVMVGALVKVGAIDTIAESAASATGGSLLVATMLILGVSAVGSGLVDNIPYVAATAPVVHELTTSLAGGGAAGTVLWWALALGADLGGNATIIGASANVVVAGIAGRAGYPIRFGEFLKYGALVTLVSIAMSAAYLWLRYFVL